jgi:valyl-tRNA synthetase
MTVELDEGLRGTAERVADAELAYREAFPGPAPGNFDPAHGASAYVLIPPIPNITGDLHIGHAVSFVLQDTLARRARGRGRTVLYPVGTDHASLSGQIAAERRLAEQGRSRHDLGREAFLRYMLDWEREHAEAVLAQSARLGIAADWGQVISTLDEPRRRATADAFRALVKEDLIYRARAITSWCVRCESCVSVAEIRRDERHLEVYRITAFTEAGTRLEIAALAPEVLVGAVAVGVPRDHPQAAELIGQRVRLPLVERTVPVIGVGRNEEPFERTARLIVPAYNAADLDRAAADGLPVYEVFDIAGRMMSTALQWHGLPAAVCRERMLNDLTDLGLLAHDEPVLRGLALHSLCGSSVIPRLCPQWYFRASALREETLAALSDPGLRFHVEKWRTRCANWVSAALDAAVDEAPRWWEGACLALVQGHDSNRDWILSRQIWWGQQIPALECADCGGGRLVEETPSQDTGPCPACGSAAVASSTDVFDTWFYGAVFSAGTSPAEGDAFGDLCVIGHDILEFWVPTQAVFCKHLHGRLPVREIVVHGLICDESGRKMSKSLGNTLELTEVLDQYGTEPVRAAVYLMLDGAAEAETLAFGEALLHRAVESAASVLECVRWIAREAERTPDGAAGRALENTARAASAEPVPDWIIRVERELDGDNPGAAYAELRAGLARLSGSGAEAAISGSVGSAVPRLPERWADRALDTVGYFHPLLVGAVRAGLA